MKSSEAFDTLVRGNPIRRKSWIVIPGQRAFTPRYLRIEGAGPHVSFFYLDSNGLRESHKWTPNYEDLVATDWEIFKG